MGGRDDDRDYPAHGRSLVPCEDCRREHRARWPMHPLWLSPILTQNLPTCESYKKLQQSVSDTFDSGVRRAPYGQKGTK